MNTMRILIVAGLLAATTWLAGTAHAEEPAADSLAAKVETLLRADGSPQAAVTAIKTTIDTHGKDEAWVEAILRATETLNKASYAAETRALLLRWAKLTKTSLTPKSNARILEGIILSMEPGSVLETPLGLAVRAAELRDRRYKPGFNPGGESPLEKKIRAALEPLKQLKSLEPSKRPAVSSEVRRAFVGVGPEAYPILARIAGESSPDVASVAIELIAELGGPAAIPFP